MHLIDVWQAHPNGTAAILGNGPSLSEHLPEDVHQGADVVLGVNRAWKWGALDWWLTLDLPPWREVQRERPPTLSYANWAVLDTALSSTDRPWLPAADGVLKIHRSGSRPAKHLLPGMETREYAETGSLPGSHSRPGSDRLVTYSSSTIGAIHLALYMGCIRLVLYGVDLSFPKGRERFCDREAQLDDEFSLTRGQFAVHRRVLEKFADAWGDRLSLVCRSPIARLRGWACPDA